MAGLTVQQEFEAVGEWWIEKYGLESFVGMFVESGAFAHILADERALARLKQNPELLEYFKPYMSAE